MKTPKLKMDKLIIIDDAGPVDRKWLSLYAPPQGKYCCYASPYHTEDLYTILTKGMNHENPNQKNSISQAEAS